MKVIKDYLRKIYGKKKPTVIESKPISESEKIKNTKVVEKILEKRKENFDAKRKSLTEGAVKNLNRLLNIYFSTFSNVADDNKISFDVLNAEWKQFCYQSNTLHKKYGELNINEFLQQVERIVKENKQFKIK